MIPGDLTAALAHVLASLAADGSLPPTAATRTASGTWRRPPLVTAAPGSYSTSLPLELASLAQRSPAAIASQLAHQLTRLPWITIARATDNYLTVTVTQAHLARLPARIMAAGPACARSDALTGRTLTAPRPPDLATTPTWPQAWRAQHAALVGTLAQAAGADVQFFPAERIAVVASPSTADVGAPSAALATFGVDAVRFALAAAARPAQAAIERQLGQPLDLTNPFVMIRYAHADAASTLRWAADLGLTPAGFGLASTGLGPTPADRGPTPAEAGPSLTPAEAGLGLTPTDHPLATSALQPLQPLQPLQLTLIDAMSWLPERVAAASRRHRPADLVAYLENLAQAWLDCSENCSALPFRGRAATTDPDIRAARLELAAAARTTLAAGLGLLWVAAPAMM